MRDSSAHHDTQEASDALCPFFSSLLSSFPTKDSPLPEGFMVPAGEWKMPEEIDVHDEELAGPHGTIRVRVYENRTYAGAFPSAVLWMHGGGFVSGSIDHGEAHAFCGELAARTGALCVSVDYRVAGNGVTYPVPMDDVVAAWSWLVDNSVARGVLGPLVIGGASAGASLAGGCAARLRDEGGRVPDGIFSAYGVFHGPDSLIGRNAPYEEMLSVLPTVLRFNRDAMVDTMRAYTGTDAPWPAYAAIGDANLVGLPPVALSFCEVDDLRASTELFAHQLDEVGIPYWIHQSRGVLHGHLNWFPSPRIPEIERTIDFFAHTLTLWAAEK